MEHHKLDPYPDPKDKGALFVNESWIADKTRLEYARDSDIDQKDDNVRIYSRGYESEAVRNDSPKDGETVREDKEHR